MALPVKANTTCDVYRSGNAPPASPDVVGVPCLLRPAFVEGRAGGAGGSFLWTHVLLVDLSADVRDGYLGAGGGNPGVEVSLVAWDEIYVPDRNGTKFAVLFVERVGYGTAQDHKRAYLQRQAATWPTNNL